MEHAGEDGAHLVNDEAKAKAQQRNHGKVDKGDGAAHGISHDKGEDQHQRRAHGDADDEHERLLHVGDIGGEARDQRGAGERVDVGERERLDLIEQVVTQVFGKTAAGVAAGDASGGAKEQRDKGEEHQDAGGGQDLFHRGAGLNGVDEVCRHKGDGHLAGNLAEHQ